MLDWRKAALFKDSPNSTEHNWAIEKAAMEQKVLPPREGRSLYSQQGMEEQGNAALQYCGIPHINGEGQQYWDLGSMQMESKDIFCRWMLEINPDAAYETAGMHHSICTGRRGTGESLFRVLATPVETVQSEQQPNSSEKMSGELRVCINHNY